MDCLVVGGSGLLGSNVVHLAADRGLSVGATFRSCPELVPTSATKRVRFDLRNADQFGSLLEQTVPDLVVNCAAMTDVDGCEHNPDHARLVNGEIPGALAGACASRDIHFVHVSTDYIFDGRLRRSYREDDVANPLQVYGQSKHLSERTVCRAHPIPLIVRLSFVYGVHATTDVLTGFPAWVRDRLDSEDNAPLFTDQWTTPTRAGYAAETILNLYDAGATGTFHVASSECCSPYEFGTKIVDFVPDASGDQLVQSSQSDVERAARRPTHTCLATEKIESELGHRVPRIETDLNTIADAFASQDR
ncbi:SDR family oxidoreductase [Haloprofundus salinisoli]|uniref:SDR family oxidoreductase n=1 Tax=Haloprofundus salinisoli TaxID=2876193 RepID=UPI001CCBBE19|nr:SDR family oxidoreductase [Haloprofundus salinisoli]